MKKPNDRSKNNNWHRICYKEVSIHKPNQFVMEKLFYAFILDKTAVENLYKHIFQLKKDTDLLHKEVELLEKDPSKVAELKEKLYLLKQNDQSYGEKLAFIVSYRDKVNNPSKELQSGEYAWQQSLNNTLILPISTEAKIKIPDADIETIIRALKRDENKVYQIKLENLLDAELLYIAYPFVKSNDIIFINEPSQKVNALSNGEGAIILNIAMLYNSEKRANFIKENNLLNNISDKELLKYFITLELSHENQHIITAKTQNYASIDLDILSKIPVIEGNDKPKFWAEVGDHLKKIQEKISKNEYSYDDLKEAYLCYQIVQKGLMVREKMDPYVLNSSEVDSRCLEGLLQRKYEGKPIDIKDFYSYDKLTLGQFIHAGNAFSMPVDSYFRKPDVKSFLQNNLPLSIETAESYALQSKNNLTPKK